MRCSTCRRPQNEEASANLDLCFLSSTVVVSAPTNPTSAKDEIQTEKAAAPRCRRRPEVCLNRRWSLHRLGLGRSSGESERGWGMGEPAGQVRPSGGSNDCTRALLAVRLTVSLARGPLRPESRLKQSK